MKPVIPGSGWAWHCKSKHSKLKKEEVKFVYVPDVELIDLSEKVSNRDGLLSLANVDMAASPSGLNQLSQTVSICFLT